MRSYRYYLPGRFLFTCRRIMDVRRLASFLQVLIEGYIQFHSYVHPFQQVFCRVFGDLANRASRRPCMRHKADIDESFTTVEERRPAQQEHGIAKNSFPVSRAIILQIAAKTAKVSPVF
jgi:hypothetical protein